MNQPGRRDNLPPELENTLDLSLPILKVRSYGLTDMGRVRASNEDQFLIAVLRKAMRIEQSSIAPQTTQFADEEGHLFLVADGMGGHQAGEHASALALESIEQYALNTLKWFFYLGGTADDHVLADFEAALHRADAKLISESAQHPDLRGMGTTLTLAYSLGNTLFVVHVGDSRCYLFRHGNLHRVTHDHTLVQELVQRGQLSPEQAARHHWRHVVTNVVGGQEPGLWAEAHKLALEAGDILLLCSDGLTEMLTDQQIATVLAFEAEPRRGCERLVAEANRLGGKDNVTAIVARYD
jgi:serine/threonine protein phosphatase PrpC